MQTVNQEMQAVNQEMQGKVEELSRSSNDMKNLLDSTDIAILFLDNALLVRRFTPQTANIIKLIPSDIGRPITDVVSALHYPALAADAKRVLQTQVPIETDISARGERWFRTRVMPYRTQDDKIDGVVITFADTTESKILEAALRKDQSGLEHRLSVQKGKLRAAQTSLLSAAIARRPAGQRNGKRARISGRAPHKPP
jgi:two-component system CheB/CheR fusion protein